VPALPHDSSGAVDQLPYTSGANDLIDGPFLGGYMEIKVPNESATMTGRACALPLGSFAAEDQRRAFYYACSRR